MSEVSVPLLICDLGRVGPEPSFLREPPEATPTAGSDSQSKFVSKKRDFGPPHPEAPMA